MARYIYQVHIADGFVDDCEELMQRCSKHSTLTYHQFTDIWKEMNLAGIYRERTVEAEIAELSEEVLHIGKRYMVANTSNFEESVAGLFLVYGLLNVQPFKGFAVLRVVPDDVAAISRIELVARRERRLDVLFVLGCVLIKGPVQFHAENREYGFDFSLRKYLEGCTSIDRFGIRPKGVFYRQNEELDIIRDLGNLTRLYEDAKAKITNEQRRPDPNLTYADRELPAKLETSLKKIINGIIEEDKPEQNTAGNERIDRIRAIKARAMRNSIDPVKHRARSDPMSPIKSPRRKADIVSKPGKIKSGSPKKPVTTGSPRKKPQSIINTKGYRSKKKSKGKKNYSSSESSESDEVYSDFRDTDDDMDTVDVDNDRENSKHPGDDLNTGAVQRVEVDIADINNLNTEPDIEELVEKEYNIHIDTMPIVIKGDTSQEFEIEFIDQLKHDSDDTVKEARAKIINLPRVSMAKIGIAKAGQSSEPADDAAPSTSALAADTVIFRKPETYNLRRPEKRELKKPGLKSKFKKLGLENLVNFEDSKKPKL